ncbi:MAG: 50S ribosomal protein L25 [bacterium]|nr:50S ribosomal protein L25 [bacterium]
MSEAKGKIIVEAEPRTPGGSGAAGRLRREGRVPGNVYGLGLDSFQLSVDPRRIEEVLRLETGRNTIFSISLAGEERKRQVMLREMQRDPVSERLVHVDFWRVDPNKPIQVNVPVRLLGTPEGVKNEGGILDFVHRQVHVQCLPGLIPDHLDVDISELHLNQHVSVKDLPSDEGVEMLDDSEMILAVVSAPRVEAEPEVEEGEEDEAEAAATEEGKEAAPDAEEKDKES